MNLSESIYIGNLVYQDNRNNVFAQPIANATVAEMKEYVIALLGYVPKWIRVQVLGGSDIELNDTVTTELQATLGCNYWWDNANGELYYQGSPLCPQHWTSTEERAVKAALKKQI